MYDIVLYVEGCVCSCACRYVSFMSFVYAYVKIKMRSILILKSVNHPVRLEFATQLLENASVLLVIVEQTAV